MSTNNPATATNSPFDSSHNSSSSSTSTLSKPQDLTISISAPGKVILHGEHSVVYGKLAVAASLGLRTNLTLVEREDHSNSVKIELPDLNLVHSYHLTDIHNLLATPIPLTKPLSSYNWEKPEIINHEELLQITQDFIDKTAGTFPLNLHQKLSLCSFFYLFTAIIGATAIPVKPFALKIETNLTVSSGSGSSASYAVTLAAAIIQYIRLKASKSEMRDITKTGYKSCKLLNRDLDKFNDKELELISKWSFMAEKLIHGTPSGIDNTICTYGSVVEFRKSSGPKLIQLCELKLLLVNTNVKRDTKRMVKNVALLRDRYPQIVESILNALDEISENAIECLKQLNRVNVVNQKEKSDSQLELKQCYEKLGELTDMNHHLLQALGVSHPKLDEICTIFKNAGLCGKLTGAGGGGYAIALVPAHISDVQVQQLITELNLRGFDTILTNLGGPGVTID